MFGVFGAIWTFCIATAGPADVICHSTMDATTSEKHKSRNRHDSDDEHKSKKRKKDDKHKKDKDREHKKDKDRESRKEHKKDKRRQKEKQGINVVDDESGEDVWIEKNIDAEGDGVSSSLFV